MEKKKYIFHFDIRNTVLVADSVTNVSVEESLNSYLTSVAWGTVEDETGRWLWCHDEPILEKPRPDAVSYYKYLESKIVRKPDDRRQFRKVTGNFTDTEVGRRFKPVYDKYLTLLEFPYASRDNLCMKGSHSDKHYHYLLPSFVKFLSYLETNDINYKIIFRTFGLDASGVLRAVNSVADDGHPEFSLSSSSCVVSHRIDKLTRKNDKIVLHSNERLISDELEIQRHLSSFQYRVSAVVDDFHYWLENDYSFTCGKPLWLDPNDNDDECQQIFFDDNVRFGDRQSIVDVRTWQFSIDDMSRQPQFVSLKEPDFAKLKDVHLVQVDLLEAIKNLDYFINKFVLCCHNFSLHQRI